MNERRRKTFNFNKEILFGEVGALICSPVIAYISSKFFSTARAISLFAVIGAILGSCVFWLFMRIYDTKTTEQPTFNNLARDVIYFTPAALSITLLIYYPSLFLASKHLINGDHGVFFSVAMSQVFAFSIFLIGMNIYRNLLAKYSGRVL